MFITLHVKYTLFITSPTNLYKINNTYTLNKFIYSICICILLIFTKNIFSWKDKVPLISNTILYIFLKIYISILVLEHWTKSYIVVAVIWIVVVTVRNRIVTTCIVIITTTVNAEMRIVSFITLPLFFILNKNIWKLIFLYLLYLYILYVLLNFLLLLLYLFFLFLYFFLYILTS